MTVCIRDFQIIRPEFEFDQKTILDWIVSAHVKTRSLLNNWKEGSPEQRTFAEELQEKLYKVGLGNNKIQKRGIAIGDCSHQNWDEMSIYNIDAASEGYQLGKRMDFYNKTTSAIFERFYSEGKPLPPHIVHVTCTGYVAPSPAQKLVSSKAGGRETILTNAYHMGCYGAFPSIRMGVGHFHATQERSDIVHTEIGSIHMNPTFHTTEQLVVQSLFADGFIKYTVDAFKPNKRCLKILALQEEVIDNSTTNMTWVCQEWGFQMSLAKDVPILIYRAIEKYLERLSVRAKRPLSDLQNAYYAIHPGGPKIIEQTAELLKLKPHQFKYSEEILRECGNMSSATLPHVWEKMLKDESIHTGDLIVSLAFGPGLSISGGLFEVG